MPPTNPARRQALTDAAIELLASSGAHGLTHRTVEQKAGLPQGTASNYFRSREALLVAAAERIAELTHADTDRATDQPAALADLLTESLLTAATTLRARYLAIFELQLESSRRPVLAAALAGLQDTALRITAGHHDKLGLAIPRENIPALIMLYGGALFTLVTAPPELLSRDLVQSMVQGMVQGIVYGCAPPGAARAGAGDW
ncbi:TetR family transcriptional regulator [Acrocarpospora corrugata]|uniref:TetR family transcriptional regulator n=1 Tax=Acrocarpospora corrugata TaxID=35763 RepID=A0A5M3VU57_9ACTN|nr:TetR/AcrR family transcriptional regulator [Acrocarpospora corrugata]GES00337.1 TetR family transcriptional regulator [Acrocarpospora corrugata]